jgi:glycosyltransferase involved in cell wall biosynthesis
VTTSALRLPRLSIVTPSFNRATFLRDSIESVLGQGYPNLEYVVVDGGSTDGTQAILAEYASRFSWWVSEPDRGMYDAINKGFAHTSGEVMAWLNSDDKYLPWTFAVVAEIFSVLPEIEWLTTCFPLFWDAAGRAVVSSFRPGFSREAIQRGENLPGGNWYATEYLQQESTFWRRSLWDRVGGALDTRFRLAADFDLWARFSQEADLYAVGTPLAGFRVHGDQKTARERSAYFEEAKRSLSERGGRTAGRIQSLVQSQVVARLPGRLRRSLVGAGALARRPLVVYELGGRGWHVDDLLTGR